jgi:hypothetical protein
VTPDEDPQPPHSAHSELDRVFQRPTTPPPALLSVFYAEVAAWNETEDFARRLRELVFAGVKAGLEGDFESDSLPETDLPQWAPEAWEATAARYEALRGEEAWTVQDILFAFDPKQREWSWWDVTLQGGNLVSVWVDSAEEAVYACEELRWMIAAAGARNLVGPLLRDATEWEQQRSLGAGRVASGSGEQ